MEFTKGFKTTASPSWVQALLVGSNNVIDIAAHEVGGVLYLAVATAADLVVINVTAGTRKGYITKASGFSSVDFFPSGAIYAVAVADGKVYYTTIAAIVGSTAVPATTISTTTGPYATCRLGANTATKLKCVGPASGTGSLATPNMLYVIDGTRLNFFNLTAASADTSWVIPDGFAAGDFGANTLAAYWGRMLHVWYDTDDATKSPNIPSLSYGRVDDAFAEASTDVKLWKDVIDGTGTIVQGAGVRTFVMRSSDGSEQQEQSYYLCAAGGSIGFEVDWAKTAWPAFAPASGKYAAMFMKARTPSNSWQYQIERGMTEGGSEEYVAMVSDDGGATWLEEVAVGTAVASGRFRIIKSINANLDDASYWDGSGSYSDGSTTGNETVAPRFRVDLQYDDTVTPGVWETLLTHYTDDDEPLVASVGVATDDDTDDVEGYFDDFIASDASPAAYRTLTKAQVFAAAVQGRAANFPVAAMVFNGHVMPIYPQGYATDFWGMGSALVPARLVEEFSTAYDGTAPQAYKVLVSIGPSSVAFNGDGSQLAIGTDKGITIVNADSLALLSNHWESLLPSQPVGDDNIDVLVSDADEFFYGGGAGCGYVEPDYTDPADVTNFTATPDGANYDLAWTDPADTDFYGTVIGRLAKTSFYDEDLIEWLLSGGATWCIADPWTDDFTTLDAARWTASSECSISGGKLLISVLAGASEKFCLSDFSTLGDFDMEIDFSEFTSTCADVGDMVHAGFGVTDVSGDNTCRMERQNSEADGDLYSFQVIVATAIVLETDIATSDTSGKLRIRRRGSRVEGFYQSNGNWIRADVYDGFTTEAYPAIYVDNDDANAVASCKFDNLVVDARPDYLYSTAEAKANQASTYRYFAKTFDEAGNEGALVGATEIPNTAAETGGDPWVDSFGICDTLIDENITVVERGTVGATQARMAAPQASADNQGRCMPCAMPGTIDPDFDVDLMALTGGANPQFVIRPGDQTSGGWMGMSFGHFTNPKKITEAGAPGDPIQSISAAETDDGDLMIVYEVNNYVIWNIVDKNTGAIGMSHPLGRGAFPCVAKHRATGRIVLAYRDYYTNDLVNAQAYYDSAWHDYGEIRNMSYTVQIMKMASLRTFGSERMILVVTKSAGIQGVLISDDAGASWRLGVDDSDMDAALVVSDAHLDRLTLAAGPAGTGEMAVLAISQPATGVTQFGISVDGVEWTAVFSDAAAQRAIALCAMEQRVHDGSQNMETRSNWCLIYQDDLDGVSIRRRIYADGPNRWSTSSPSSNTALSLRSSVVSAVGEPDTCGLALIGWRNMLVALVGIVNDVSGSELWMFEASRWERPPQRGIYDWNWFSGMGLPTGALGWDVSTNGGSAVINFEDMSIATAATEYLHYYENSIFPTITGYNPLLYGVKIRFRLKTPVASATCYHGLTAKVDDPNSGNFAIVSLYVTGRGKVRLFDANALAWLGPEWDAGDVGAEIEGVLVIGRNETVARASLWIRAVNDSISAFHELAVDAEEVTLNIGSGNYLMFGALAGGAAGRSLWREVAWDNSLGSIDGHLFDDSEGYDIRRAKWSGGVVRPYEPVINVGDGNAVLLGGGLPAARDEWRIAAESDHAVENMLKADSSKWRDDDATKWREILLLSDTAAGGRGFTPGVCGLIGANFPLAAMDFNDTNSWATPSVSVIIDGWCSSGTLGARVARSATIATWTRRWRPGTGKPSALDAAWSTNLQDRELAGLYLCMLNGVARGKVYKVLDNGRGMMSFDGDAPYDDGAATGDAFYLYGKTLVNVPPPTYTEAQLGAAYKYLRILIPPCNAPEGYKEFAVLAVGPLHTIQTDASCRTWADLAKKTRFRVKSDRGDDGVLNPSRTGGPLASTTLRWNGMNASQSHGLDALLRRLDGPMTPVVYLPVLRRNENLITLHGNYDAMLCRMVVDELDRTPMDALEVWQGAAITLEEIPTE